MLAEGGGHRANSVFPEAFVWVVALLSVIEAHSQIV